MNNKYYKEININDINGIRIGHAQNVEGGTGCTAIICDKGAFAGVDVRGGAPASRETELLKPVNMIQQIHCVMLSGGSAYGLASGDGAMQYLEEKGIGFDTGFGIVPIVCGAALFDLNVGDAKCRPDKEMGYEACKNSENAFEIKEGNAGAGTGATVGKFRGIEYAMKSGIGIYAVQINNVQCAAVVAVNALGDVLDYDTGKIIAGILDNSKEKTGCTVFEMYKEIGAFVDVFKGNTTVGCIITNAKLNKDQCNKLAQIAHNGYAKTISPVHTTADGDTIFVLATCETEVGIDSLGALATEVMGRAINRAVRTADSAYGYKAAKALK